MSGDLAFGLQMTVVGMGTVFALLTVLMLALHLLGRLDRVGRGRAAPSPEAAGGASAGLPVASAPEGSADSPDEGGSPRVQVLADGLTEDELAAISTAVLVHRAVRRAQAAPSMRSYAPGSHLYASRWVAVGRQQRPQRSPSRRS